MQKNFEEEMIRLNDSCSNSIQKDYDVQLQLIQQNHLKPNTKIKDKHQQDIVHYLKNN